MKIVAMWLAMFSGLSLAGSAVAGKVTKESITLNGEERSYYLYVPKKLPESGTVPLVITLHGSGRNGSSLVVLWQDLADKERFIVAGPDSKNSSVWAVPGDGPEFLCELADTIRSKYPVDAKRMYLFGHSGGAVHGLVMAALESDYFAAVAVHAGAFRQPGEFAVTQYAERKMPLAIFVGTLDAFFPLVAVRQTRDAFKQAGFPVELTEIPAHDHNYYVMASRINRSAWEFLKTKQLDGDPRYIKRIFR